MPNADDRTWACVIEQRYFGVPVVNTFGVQDENSSALAPVALASAVGDDFANAYDNVQVTGLVYERAVVRQLVSPFLYGEAAIVHDGDVAGEGMPGQTAVVVSLHTGLQGRSNRGRFYLSGVPTTPGGVSDPNHMDGGFLAGYEAATANFLGNLAADNLNLIVISRFSGYDLVPHDDGSITKRPALRATPVYNLVTSTSIDTRLDSQRRRLGRS